MSMVRGIKGLSATRRGNGKGRRALITGGAGFVGSHLAEELIERGFEVTVVDDLSTGRRENLAKVEGAAGFRLVQGDVTDEALMEEPGSAKDRGAAR